MAWCKLEDTFYDDPKFIRLAKLLGVKKTEAKGLMASLWSWAVRHAKDGDLSDYRDCEIEAACGWEGSDGLMVKSCIETTFLDLKNNSLKIHNFWERNDSHRAAIKQKKYRKLKHALRDSYVTEEVRVPNALPRVTPLEEREEREEIDITRNEIIAGKEILYSSPPPTIQTTMLAPLARKRSAPRPETPAAVFRIRDKFCSCYSELYNGATYDWNHARDGKQAKLLIANGSEERITEILAEIDAYFGWKDPDVIKRAHAFSTGFWSFTQARHRLRADIAAPERLEASAVISQERYHAGKEAYKQKQEKLWAEPSATSQAHLTRREAVQVPELAARSSQRSGGF